MKKEDVMDTVRDSIEVRGVQVTPEVAKRWLSMSNGNRKIKMATVRAYARDMEAGRWKFNGEAICFDKDGTLRDGHHRLEAVIIANKAVNMMVIYGLDADECDVYDVGVTRSFADINTINNKPPTFSNTKILALVRTHLLMQYGIKKPTVSEIDEFIGRNQECLEWVAKICKANTGSIASNAGVMYAVFCAVKCGVDRATLEHFIDILMSGYLEGKDERPAAILYRDLLSLGKYGGRNVSIQRQRVTECAIRDFVDRKVRTKSYIRTAKPVYSDKPIIKEI